MIFDKELYFTKSGSTELSISNTAIVTEQIAIEAVSYKEAIKPSFAYFIYFFALSAPSADTDLAVYVRHYYTSSSYYNVSASFNNLQASVISAGDFLQCVPVYPFRGGPYENYNIVALAFSARTVATGVTMKIQARLVPFKI